MRRLLISVFLSLFLVTSTQAADRQDNYGMSHAFILAGALAVTWVTADKLFPNDKRVADAVVSIVAIAGAGYFYERERKARGGDSFDDWYRDSQADALMPAAVSLFAIRYRFK